ncbi:cell wall biosynthesis/cell cycle regulator [Schizosaccharomyces cryophilus OY26]|uniref:Cell wall biosynthesis/cell cycle regulator n=1 Tax=Schizosaccharomyces cryophilus (strain OY26 / ATCC MYA-4695 / CBS 11777 / NBRC 106824 / NRRL Y48691) TaxID=653667 RepID=S9W5Y7_SCHCR|nr:cell wall biosynthesis/cell cycle regulator [Schizosaccharomyces cryophilus OY26]EPY53974.1 cell wall biosynthesis/cell cycle regulator [Schizosaccharomyces cryophilus OY26]
MTKNAFSSMADSVSSFFQSLTTSNRHADPSFNPSRRDKQSRLPTPLQSIATSGYTGVNASQTGLLSDSRSNSTQNLSNVSSQAPTKVPYVPGSRSNELANSAMDIQMQDISPNGTASLPAPVSESWRRIDRWAEENYYELYCQLCPGATAADVDSLEYELECTLPRDVRESLYIHDGQDRGGQLTGILFGITLLDIEEIEEESELWRRVAQSYAEATIAGKIDQAVASRQSSFPPGAVQCVYAHPGWIPFAKDFVGNNIAVDLAPGPAGHWGQVILFGRDQDTKYVIARSWADFLAIVAYDMENGKWIVDEEDNSLRLIYGPPREQWSYLDILKYRARKAERRKHKKQETKKTAVVPKDQGNPNEQDLSSSTAVLESGLEDVPLYGHSKDDDHLLKKEAEEEDLGLMDTPQNNKPMSLVSDDKEITKKPATADAEEASITRSDEVEKNESTSEAKKEVSNESEKEAVNDTASKGEEREASNEQKEE